MDPNQLKKLLTDECYQDILSRIAREINHPVDDTIDVPLLSVGWDRIRHSTLQEADFYRLLQEYSTLLVQYYAKGYALFLENLSKTFPNWEQAEEDITDEAAEVSTVPILALATTMIEFYYLLNNDHAGLLSFFKKEDIEDPESFLDQCKTPFEYTMSAKDNRL
ncbi:hypothetical protein [Chitinophaga pinensis]|uniref:Uncharacterized protein n=1 Tax=Chitinophaga pinensis (strain ATCC 43595 / DSM 2588 / LMG 13176 / NBRC 15968 / NCIMB 11800 / UQM 2034) TaxID=485918 RepID=A0A979G3H5_CHIPD|nr:hypothetical protein [Chitinophaga pinensis]ACU60008.1 hypothetical protein Cpin_2524 [Chitinophaga pinensis DSM 2588]